MKLPPFARVFALAALLACRRDNQDPVIPTVPVREEVFTNSVQAMPLHTFPNYIYINGGTKGIIVYKNAPDSYIAMDRNCPHHPSADCQLAEVDPSGLFIADSCCGSRWDMQGYLIQGPAVRPLARYTTVFTPPNRLFITNLSN